VNEKLDLVKDSTMVECANLLANAIRRLAPYDAIRKSVRVGRSRGRASGSRTIQVWVGNKNVPYARAFDVGSGIHSQKAAKATYRIAPKNSRYLAFFWKITPPHPANPVRSYVGTAEDGKKLFNYVDHPGVRGVNYTKAAEDSVRKTIRKKIAADGVQNLRLYLRSRFSTGKK